MSNFPTSLDDSSSIPNPATTDKTNSPSHADLHGATGDAVKAVEAKLGIGATTPVANSILFGTSTGTSRWGTVTSAEMLAAVSNETGTGSLVFGTAPTLSLPKIDTIEEATPSNGVTVDGLSIKDSKLNTSNSVVTSNITNSSVTADKLNLNPLQSYLATDQGTTSLSYADLATVQSVTVTVGANGLAYATWSAGLYNVAATKRVSVAVSGASTVAASDDWSIRNDVSAFSGTQSTSHLFTGLTPGSNVFTLKFKTVSGTAQFFERNLIVIPL